MDTSVPLQLCNFLANVIQFFHPCKLSWSNRTWTILLRIKHSVKRPSCQRSSFAKAENRGGTQSSLCALGKFSERHQVIMQQALSMPHSCACESQAFSLCPQNRWDRKYTPVRDMHNTDRITAGSGRVNIQNLNPHLCYRQQRSFQGT